jgi:hypothetical protein
VHDIALFKVTPPFHFSKNVQPVQLPQPTDEVPERLMISGWGYSHHLLVSSICATSEFFTYQGYAYRVYSRVLNKQSVLLGSLEMLASSFLQLFDFISREYVIV